jgi:hypothetical protein
VHTIFFTYIIFTHAGKKETKQEEPWQRTGTQLVNIIEIFIHVVYLPTKGILGSSVVINPVGSFPQKVKYEGYIWSLHVVSYIVPLSRDWHHGHAPCPPSFVRRGKAGGCRHRHPWHALAALCPLIEPCIDLPIKTNPRRPLRPRTGAAPLHPQPWIDPMANSRRCCRTESPHSLLLPFLL